MSSGMVHYGVSPNLGMRVCNTRPTIINYLDIKSKLINASHPEMSHINLSQSSTLSSTVKVSSDKSYQNYSDTALLICNALCANIENN